MSGTGLRLITYILTWRDARIRLINQGMIVSGKIGDVLGFNRDFLERGNYPGGVLISSEVIHVNKSIAHCPEWYPESGAHCGCDLLKC